MIPGLNEQARDTARGSWLPMIVNHGRLAIWPGRPLPTT
jgi:hypothetical protein